MEVKTLMYYDGPQLVLIAREGHPLVVAVAIFRDGMQWPMFGVEVSERDWQRFAANEIDLRSLFISPAAPIWYFLDLCDAKPSLVQAALCDQYEHDYVPGSGIFARDTDMSPAVAG